MTKETYVLAADESQNHQPEFPERTSKQSVPLTWYGNIYSNIRYKVWPTREAMAKAIRMQESMSKGEPYVPCMPLNDTEGYE